MFLIAEIGQAHEGSLGIAHSYIDALAETGVNAVKFQTHIAHAESSIHENFRINFSYEDQNRFNYWKRMEFSFDQWVGLKKHCEEKGLEFISSPFSIAAVNLLEKLNVTRYKIGSGEVTNFLMLEKIALTGKPVILSSGMSNWDELDKAVDFLKRYNVDLTILQCTTAYPTKPEQWGLNIIEDLKQRYKSPIGFSDHSGEIFACLAATTLGAEVLEFHVVFDKKMFGPDSIASLDLNQIKTLVEGVHQIKRSLNEKIDKSVNIQYTHLKEIFEKSLAVNKDLQKNHIITKNDLEAKKPKNFGISASNYLDVIGKKLSKPIKAWDFLTKDSICEE